MMRSDLNGMIKRSEFSLFVAVAFDAGYNACKEVIH